MGLPENQNLCCHNVAGKYPKSILYIISSYIKLVDLASPKNPIIFGHWRSPRRDAQEISQLSPGRVTVQTCAVGVVRACGWPQSPESSGHRKKLSAWCFKHAKKTTETSWNMLRNWLDHLKSSWICIWLALISLFVSLNFWLRWPSSPSSSRRNCEAKKQDLYRQPDALLMQTVLQLLQLLRQKPVVSTEDPVIISIVKEVGYGKRKKVLAAERLTLNTFLFGSSKRQNSW